MLGLVNLVSESIFGGSGTVANSDVTILGNPYTSREFGDLPTMARGLNTFVALLLSLS